MKDAYFRFMSAIDIDCYQSIQNSTIGSNLSYTDVLQLFIINHKQQMTISELANRLKLSRPATTQKVNELVNKGLVIKKQSLKDKRVTYLSLSKDLIQQSKDTKASTLMDKVDAQFSKETKEEFARVLNFMTDCLMEK